MLVLVSVAVSVCSLICVRSMARRKRIRKDDILIRERLTFGGNPDASRELGSRGGHHFDFGLSLLHGDSHGN